MMTPDVLCKQADHVLRLLAGQDTLTSDPAELAAVLRTAAAACSEIEAHNSMVIMSTNFLNSPE